MKSEKTVTEGMLVPCLMAGSDEWSTAEIIKIRPALTSSADTDGVGDALDETKRLFYVHYVDFNKRLDCWVAEDRLDLANARLKGQEPVETKKEDAGGVAGRCLSPTPSASNLAASTSSSPAVTPSRKRQKKNQDEPTPSSSSTTTLSECEAADSSEASQPPPAPPRSGAILSVEEAESRVRKEWDLLTYRVVVVLHG